MSLGRDRERGNALVEFTWLAILLMIPLVYLMLTVFQLQKAAYAMEAASREAARAYAAADYADKGAAVAAAQLAASDHGVELRSGQVQVGCGACRPGDEVSVVVATEVSLPFVPRFFDDRVHTSIGVEATHDEPVDVYRNRPAP